MHFTITGADTDTARGFNCDGRQGWITREGPSAYRVRYVDAKPGPLHYIDATTRGSALEALCRVLGEF